MIGIHPHDALRSQSSIRNTEIVGEYGAGWGTAQARYTHDLGLDEPLLRTPAGGSSQYYHQDGLGSVVAMTDENGATLGAARYDAWGMRVAKTGVIESLKTELFRQIAPI